MPSTRKKKEVLTFSLPFEQLSGGSYQIYFRGCWTSAYSPWEQFKSTVIRVSTCVFISWSCHPFKLCLHYIEPIGCRGFSAARCDINKRDPYCPYLYAIDAFCYPVIVILIIIATFFSLLKKFLALIDFLWLSMIWTIQSFYEWRNIGYVKFTIDFQTMDAILFVVTLFLSMPS